jgi:FkbM family methyltransferase
VIEPKGMQRINPGGEPALWIFHGEVGDEGICGLAVARDGQAPDTACLMVSRQAFTQKIMYQVFAEQQQLYEPCTSLLALGALRPGDIALDIGAHVGYFSTLFRLAVGATGTVFAFEPMPDTYRRLLRNVLANRFTNVLPLPMAVAERSGAAIFHISADNEGESSLLDDGGKQTANVQVTSLDDLFRDGLPARPRLMKIDAEGVEVNILNGARQWFETYAPDMVICEINREALARGGASEQLVRAYFEARGYRCAVISLGVKAADSGLDLRGGHFYRYLAPGEFVADGCRFVFNLMCVRAGSGLYPDEVL